MFFFRLQASSTRHCSIGFLIVAVLIMCFSEHNNAQECKEDSVQFIPASIQCLDHHSKTNSSSFALWTNKTINPFVSPDSLRDIGWDPLNHSIQARQNRVDIISQAFEISKVDTTTYVLYDFDCGEFASATQLEFSGYFREIDEQSPANEIYDTLVTPNEFNIPCYMASIQTPNFGHAVNTFMIGNDISNLDDWYFVEPQNDIPINFGDYNFPEDTYHMNIRQLTFYYDPYENHTQSGAMFVIFTFTDGEVDDSVWITTEEEIVGTRPTDPTSVDESFNESIIPETFSLKQNYPNPFNPSTTITYEIKRRSFVNMHVYNILGEVVEILVSGERQAGIHTITWNTEGKYSSGVYFYRISIGDESSVKKMVLLK